MKITMLGTGNALVTECYNTCFVIEDNKQYFMVELGIAGSGSASMAAILSQTNSEYWLRQTTKLLVFSKCALKDALNDVDAIKKLSSEIILTIKKVEANIKELEDEKCSLDKDTIKNSKECLKYLGKCKAELDKLL